MKLHFLGANRQVTGSRYCLESGGSKVMIDCGLFQERAYLSRNWEPCPIDASELDALLLTHVHIDHSGLIPKLVRDGFPNKAPIYATRPSTELAELMLLDSAEIQVEDALYKKKRHKREGRRGKYPEQPLYSEQDVQRALRHFRATPYQRPVSVSDTIQATFYDAGHILGSAMIEIRVTESGATRSLLFSGDIGQVDKPLVRDPTFFKQADYVVMESTYGDRDHEDGGDIETQLERVIQQTVARGGNVVIPTFAVERSQELMYYISRLVHDDRIPDIPIFLDSPMAIDVTAVYRRFRDCFDEDTWKLIASREPPLQFPGLTMTRSSDESKAINQVTEPCIIMATSGMCTAGRIKHHLRHNIGRAESTILFVGYQGKGTLGRHILDGKEEVRIHGRNYRVRAQVAQIYGFSGHADRAGLIGWISSLQRAPKHVFLTHGDEEAAASLAGQIQQHLGWPVSIPEYRDVVEL